MKHAYAYDAEGNRVTETNYNAGNASTRNSLVDPKNSNAQVVEEYDGASTLLAHNDWDDAELLRVATLNNGASWSIATSMSLRLMVCTLAAPAK